MAASRGDRIRKAREMRGETRDQVAAATGVNPKTIARIERGEVTNSPKATILEDYLGITPRLAATEPPTAPSVDQATIDRVLDEVPFLELLAAIAKRYARATGASHLQQPDSAGRYKIFTEDVPSPDEDPNPQPDVRDTGKLP